MKINRTLANFQMLLAALIWGTTFVAQQLGMRSVGPLTYTGIRFLIGAAFILPLALREYGRLADRGVSLDRQDLLRWAGLGVLLFSGAVCQQIGMLNTTVTNAGFLTALYVPLVPMLAWLFHKNRPHLSIWPAVAGSLIGTFMLSGGRLEAFTSGDAWVLASAFFWAAHVLWVGRIAAEKGTPILVAFGQFVVCGTLASILALALEPINSTGIVAAMPTILYGGLLSVGVGFTLQVMAQRHTRPTDAAILLSSETLFAAIAGAVYLGERLNATQIAGGALIFASILAVQLLPPVMRGKVPADTPP